MNDASVYGAIRTALMADTSYAALSPGGVFNDDIPEDKSRAFTVIESGDDDPVYNSESPNNGRKLQRQQVFLRFYAVGGAAVDAMMNSAERVFQTAGVPDASIRRGPSYIRKSPYRNKQNQVVYLGSALYTVCVDRAFVPS